MAGAPVTDEYDELQPLDGNVPTAYGFKGSPYVGDNLKDYRRNRPSPTRANENAHSIMQRYLGDARVTITQGTRSSRSQRQRRARQFLAFLSRGHFPGDPARQMDVYRTGRMDGPILE